MIFCIIHSWYRYKPVCSYGHSGATSVATSAATFSVAIAAAPLLFFVTSKKRQRRCFFSQKSGRALFYANNLPQPLLLINFFHDFFRFAFSDVTVWSLYFLAFFHSALATTFFWFSRTNNATSVTFSRCNTYVKPS